MRSDQRFAFAKWEIQLTDQLDYVVHRVFVSDVKQRPLLVVVDQVRAARDPPTRLVVEFNNVWEKGIPFEHGSWQ